VGCSSAFEAEYAGLFTNGTSCQAIRTTLQELGYLQEATEESVMDNSTTYGIINGTAKQKRTKAIDICVSIEPRIEYDKANSMYYGGLEGESRRFLHESSST
jgi:hypothetical protein